MLSIPPVISFLIMLQLLKLKVLDRLENPTIFASAIFNKRHVAMVAKQFLESSFVETTGAVEKLDKLIIVCSDYDYFSVFKLSWISLWRKFGKYFWDKITNSPTLHIGTEPLHTLFLLPSEYKANTFFERGLKKNKHFFIKFHKILYKF